MAKISGSYSSRYLFTANDGGPAPLGLARPFFRSTHSGHIDRPPAATASALLLLYPVFLFAAHDMYRCRETERSQTEAHDNNDDADRARGTDRGAPQGRRGSRREFQ